MKKLIKNCITNHFIANKSGAILSIQFAAITIVFVSMLYLIYDVYHVISLQNKLERVTYSAASLFRERSALYPQLDDTLSGQHQVAPANSICLQSQATSYPEKICFYSYEYFDQQQVDELQALMSKLMGNKAQVDVQVESLIISPYYGHNQEDIDTARLFSASHQSCADDCAYNNSYFAKLTPMTDYNNSQFNYTKLSSFVKFRVSSNVGRWVPLYRVSACIINSDAGLYLSFTDKKDEPMFGLPNLCTSVVVISRCNEPGYYNSCPYYIIVPS